MTSSERIEVFEPLRRVNAMLLELLRSFDEDDWTLPTVHRDRDVKDLTAHLLHGSLRRVTALRDGYQRPMPVVTGIGDLIMFIQQDNRDFMVGMRRVSPTILIELIALYDPLLVSLFEGLDPQGEGLGVAWAGEMVSALWFDVAREYTEKWHHQQQLRDATGREPLYEPALLSPVLETFARGLPHAYRDLQAPEGTSISIATSGAVALGWTLRHGTGAWALSCGTDPAADSFIALPADTAWRLWTKSIDRERARASILVTGDPASAEPLLQFVAIMA
jgi:hypothetical protein